MFTCLCGDEDCTLPALLRKYVPDKARALALAVLEADGSVGEIRAQIEALGR
jgi:hypothetical protein